MIGGTGSVTMVWGSLAAEHIPIPNCFPEADPIPHLLAHLEKLHSQTALIYHPNVVQIKEPPNSIVSERS